uniref:SAM domain-containing protein n=1 Tax=Elaeophora elaphi TaxID=1147741 RepID=A0A0R3RHD5_9BILA
MSTKEKLKCARTMGEILLILNMPEYLPLFEKANILQASALRLLREADLKHIGIDNSGRQKLLRAIRYLSKDIPITVDEKIRQRNEVNVDSRYPKINEFCLQKAEDELLRCKVELNLKRNELARIQKEAKLIREIFDITNDTRQYAQKVRENCNECGTLFIQRLAIELENLLNRTFLPNTNSNSSNQNTQPLTVVQNTNSQYPNIQQYLPELPLQLLKKHNSRRYFSNETGSNPWYTKIWKSTTIQGYKQPSAIIYYHQQVDEDERYHERTTISLSTQATSQYEHPSFMDGLFSKFAKNKTSTPYKQPSTSTVKRFSNNIRHQSFVHHSRQKYFYSFIFPSTAFLLLYWLQFAY